MYVFIIIHRAVIDSDGVREHQSSLLLNSHTEFLNITCPRVEEQPVFLDIYLCILLLFYTLIEDPSFYARWLFRARRIYLK